VEKIKENLDVKPPSPISMVYPEAIEMVFHESPPSSLRLHLQTFLALMLLAGDESLAEWLTKNLSERDILQIEKIRQETQGFFLSPSAT